MSGIDVVAFPSSACTIESHCDTIDEHEDAYSRLYTLKGYPRIVVTVYVSS